MGSDADLVLFDPAGTTRWSVKTTHMRVDYNPYEGRTTVGSIRMVLSRGDVIVDGDTFYGHRGRGRFLRRSSFQQP